MKSDSVVIRKLRKLFMSLRWFSSSLNVHVGGESHCIDFLKKLHKGSKIKGKVRHYVPLHFRKYLFCNFCILLNVKYGFQNFNLLVRKYAEFKGNYKNYDILRG